MLLLSSDIRWHKTLVQVEHNLIGGSSIAHVLLLYTNVLLTVEEETYNRGFARAKKTEACRDLWLHGISDVSHVVLPLGCLVFCYVTAIYCGATGQ